MWALIHIMAYISRIIGRRGFVSKDDLREIICPESYGGVTFDLGSLLQGRMWSLIPTHENIILCMSVFNHVPSRDTLHRVAISSLRCKDLEGYMSNYEEKNLISYLIIIFHLSTNILKQINLCVDLCPQDLCPPHFYRGGTLHKIMI